MPSISSPAAALPAPPTKRCRGGRGDAGFTIIEVLVTALIVILIASASAKALITTSHASGDQRLRAQADLVAAKDQERLRGLSDDQLNSLSQVRTETISGTAFTVTSTASYVDTTGATTCTSTAAAYFKVSSTATWAENYSKRTDTTVTEESVLARPVTGDMYVQATDQTGASLSGVSVTATGPDTQNDTTNAGGCVLFAGLAPGTYAVALADAGFVDPNGNTSPPNVTAAVTATSAVSPSGSPFHLGQAATVAASFTSPGAAYGYYGEAAGVSWLGSGASYGMSGGYRTAPTAPSSAPATTLTTLPLFPFDVSATATPSYTNNYSVWGGRCLQQEPPAGTDTFTVNPGVSGQAASVVEPALAVGAINYKNGAAPPTAVRPAHVKLTFNQTAGATCRDSWYPTLAAGATVPVAGWLANPGQPFASTASGGAMASASSTGGSPQTGQITVCADYNGYYSTVATTNSNYALTGTAAPPITITNAPLNLGLC